MEDSLEPSLPIRVVPLFIDLYLEQFDQFGKEATTEEYTGPLNPTWPHPE